MVLLPVVGGIYIGAEKEEHDIRTEGGCVRIGCGCLCVGEIPLIIRHLQDAYGGIGLPADNAGGEKMHIILIHGGGSHAAIPIPADVRLDSVLGDGIAHKQHPQPLSGGHLKIAAAVLAFRRYDVFLKTIHKFPLRFC